MIQQVLTDTYLDRLQRSSLTHFAAYYSITYYTSPKHIRSIEFGAHIATIPAHDARNAIQTAGLAMIHRPMTCLILPVFRQLSSAALCSTTRGATVALGVMDTFNGEEG